MKSLLIFCFLVVGVVGHTVVTNLILAGQTQSGCLRLNGNDSFAYLQGGILSSYPIMARTSPAGFSNGILAQNYTCGHMPWAGRPAPGGPCTVAAGQTIGMQYWHDLQPGDNAAIDQWISHGHKGPIMVSMARLPSSGSIFDAQWFKIFNMGITYYDANNFNNVKWASADTLNSYAGVISFTIPSDLAPGSYILRTELLALHEAMYSSGAQPYVKCADLIITGSGTANPPGVKIPSASWATLDHPGILFNAYVSPFKTGGVYPYPGGDAYVPGGSTPSPTPSPAPYSPTPAPSGSNVKNQGGGIEQDTYLEDPTGKYFATQQKDGNLVIYQAGTPLVVVWASNYADGIAQGQYTTVLQNDGNLVTYKINVNPFVAVWSSQSYNRGTAPYYLVMQSNRNMVIMDSQNVVVWNTGTLLGGYAPRSNITITQSVASSSSTSGNPFFFLTSTSSKVDDWVEDDNDNNPNNISAAGALIASIAIAAFALLI